MQEHPKPPPPGTLQLVSSTESSAQKCSAKSELLQKPCRVNGYYTTLHPPPVKQNRIRSMRVSDGWPSHQRRMPNERHMAPFIRHSGVRQWAVSSLLHLHHLKIRPMNMLQHLDLRVVPTRVRRTAEKPASPVIRQDHSILLQRLKDYLRRGRISADVNRGLEPYTHPHRRQVGILRSAGAMRGRWYKRRA